MKRSQVNDIMVQADDMIRSFGFTLPPFAYWSPETFKRNAAAARPIIEAQCGWDITDYGAGDFEALGLFLFTLRNGRLADLQRGGGMCYAEKLLISRQDQLSPMHTHVIKAEDIINRGGATLVVELFGSDAEGPICRRSGRHGLLRWPPPRFCPRGETPPCAWRKRHPHAWRLARLLGRWWGCVDRGGVHRKRRQHRQYFPRTHRPVLRN